MMYHLLLSITFSILVLTGCSDGVTSKDAQPGLAESRHSDSLNEKVKALLNGYYSLSESLVAWDSTGAVNSASALVKKLDSTGFEELNEDTAVYGKLKKEIDGLRSGLVTITQRPDLTEKRQNFNSVTEHLYAVLNAMQFDRSKIYLHECTMPYNDGGSGLWLSETADSLRNPYLGLYHPKYKKAMLDCGITRDSLNFLSYSGKENGR